jgi:hypothetical protein
MIVHKKYWYLIITNIILRFILILFLIYHIVNKDAFWSFFTTVMIVIALIPVILRRYLRIDLPLLFDFFITLSLLFHVGNGLLETASFIDIYNKFTHFFSSVVVAFTALLFLYVLHEFKGDIVTNKHKVLFDIIVITIALGAIWELMEWGTDYLFGWKSQVSLDDTMLDLLADSLGGIFMSIIGSIMIKRGVMDTIAMNIKIQLEKLLR